VIGRAISHYLIEERLGQGGMGDVYLALDLALGRRVALKLLKDDPSLDAAQAERRRARLVLEAQSSARLQHPAIATFYEGGEWDGQAFLALEYVAGETLRQRLARGAFSPAEAAGIAAVLLEALAHAHAAGLVHRDIKPENVVLTPAGGVKLLDFGLAREHVKDDSLPTRRASLRTEEGLIVGTPGYLAPEQVERGASDPASDVFAVGALLYELVSGRLAFPGATAAERLRALTDGRPLAPLPATVPHELADLIARALARDRAARPASAGAFLGELRALRNSGVLGAAGEGEAAAGPLRVAVLDFANTTGDADSDWIGGALGESLATDLGAAGEVAIVARARVARARAELRLGGGAAPGAHEEGVRVGQKLGCPWAVTGAFARAGEALTVEVHVADAATGEVTDLPALAAPLQDLFALQARIADAVGHELARRATGRAASAPTAPPGGAAPAPGSPAAYEAYVRGRQLWFRLAKGAFDEAELHFHEAIRLDPAYAPPFVGLASIHAMRFTFRTDPAELAAAAEFARRAIALAPALGEPHVWLCYALSRQWRLEDAMVEARRAMELEPRHPLAPYFGGCALLVARRLDEAVALLQRAGELDPAFGFSWLALGWAHLESGRPEVASWCFERSLAIETGGGGKTGPTAGVVAYVGETLRRMGRPIEARAKAMEALEAIARTDHMYRDTFHAFALATLGRTALDQGEMEGAKVAFGQLVAHVTGRSRTLGGGQFHAQGLAGLAAAGAGETHLDDALARMERRDEFDWSWMWGCLDVDTLPLLERAARMLGRVAQADECATRLVRARQG
jgi:TolB-like protein